MASVAGKVACTTGAGNGLGPSGAQRRRHGLIVNVLPWAGVQLIAGPTLGRVSDEGR